MFNLSSYLPQKANEPQVQWTSWDDLWAAAFSPTVYPPMGTSHLPVPTTLPPPPPVAPSPMVNLGQGAVYPGIGLASGSADFFQGPSAAVGGGHTGTGALQGAVDYRNVVQPMFYINHASFRQSVPALGASALANGGRAEPSVLGANAWPDVTLPGGASGSGQVGPQRLRRNQARASRNGPYAKAVTHGASGSAVQLPQPSDPIAEQENEVEERRTAQRGEVYHCRCGKWVLVRRRAKHEPTHGVTWPCRMCKILNRNNDQKLSRKDALKRHIKLQHSEYTDLLDRPELKLLKPGEETVDEGAIRQAMRALSADRQASA